MGSHSLSYRYRMFMVLSMAYIPYRLALPTRTTPCRPHSSISLLLLCFFQLIFWCSLCAGCPSGVLTSHALNLLCAPQRRPYRRANKLRRPRGFLSRLVPLIMLPGLLARRSRPSHSRVWFRNQSHLRLSCSIVSPPSSPLRAKRRSRALRASSSPTRYGSSSGRKRLAAPSSSTRSNSMRMARPASAAAAAACARRCATRT